LKIPRLNAPLRPVCEWCYGGGWEGAGLANGERKTVLGVGEEKIHSRELTNDATKRNHFFWGCYGGDLCEGIEDGVHIWEKGRKVGIWTL
jgi:hypothetical protein